MTDTEKSIMDNPEYDMSWDDYIGQTMAKRQLQIAAKSAKMRGESMPHTLLAAGEHGIGKTTLAVLVARELGSDVKVVSGSINDNEARRVLTAMNDGDILLWEEYHLSVSGGKGKAEWQLNYLQDGVIVGPRGEEEMPKITFICTTTEVGKLPETIVSRFQLRPILQPYTFDEAVQITCNKAIALFKQPLALPSVENYEAVAKASNGNPRSIKMILLQMRDTALALGWNTKKDGYDMNMIFEIMGITPDGLDRTMRRYLQVLYNDFRDGAGLRSLEEILQEPGGLGPIERVLVQRGFIGKTRSGRNLTSEGMRRARELKATYGFIA